MKRFFKCIFVLLFLAVCALGIFFIIDYSRASEGKAPIFCLQDEAVNDGGTIIYKGAFYKVIDYHKTINYSKNIFYDDVKIGNYGMKYEDYENEWNKLAEKYKENEYTPVTTETLSSIKDIKTGATIEVTESSAEFDALINKIEFKSDAVVDGIFQYELFVSSKNSTYAFGYVEDAEGIKGGLIKNISDLSYSELDAETTNTLVQIIKANLKD